ncbi:MAG: hypothetical protein IID45_12775, partial [Planctomycetes bacterium]|nr:hypothetical protein [Planctomycetota bacterium]
MAEVIRDILIRIKLEQIGPVNLKVPTKEALKGIDKVKKAQQESTTAFLKGQKLRQDGIKKTEQVTTTSAVKSSERAIKAADGFKTLGDGAFTAARGAAFLFTSTDEGFKELIENVSIAQGSFDLFRGTIDVVKGLGDGLTALKGITFSAATANTALAATNTTVAVTGAAATTSMAGFSAILGPVALGIAAVVAIGAGLIAFLSKAKRKTKELAEAERKADQEREERFRRGILDRGGKAGGRLDRGRQARAEVEAIERQIDALRGVNTQEARRKRLTLERLKAEKEFAKEANKALGKGRGKRIFGGLFGFETGSKESKLRRRLEKFGLSKDPTKGLRELAGGKKFFRVIKPG